jgi:hypothetical protein
MIEELLTKQNLALLGVISLFLWRIVDLILRQKKKKETELQKLAFDMTKYRFGDDVDPFTRESILPQYFFYLDALEHDMNPYHRGTFKIMKTLDDQLAQKTQSLKQVHEKLEAIENKLSQHDDITLSDLWDRNLNWTMWFRETKKLLKITFSRKTKFRSVH